MTDVERATKRLQKEYEKAIKHEFVDDPLCYALYHTWRYYDAKRKKRKEAKHND